MIILYVEDDPLDADLTRRALAKTSPQWQLDIVRTKGEALEYLKRKPVYDVMLTDLKLPDGNGFALLSHIRLNELPMAVVMITGQGDEETAVAALKAGANDYVVKNQDYLNHLHLVLENAVQQHRSAEARKHRPLSVLYLENNPTDIDLTRRHFAAHAPHIHLEIIQSSPEMMNQLRKEGVSAQYDVIVLEYQQHDLDVIDLLKSLRQVHRLDIPIVLVTGHGNEEVAAQVLRLGADDYVVKSPGYLYQLPGLLENAYHRAQLCREQAALQTSEERFRRLSENAPDIIYRYRLHPTAGMEYISPAVETIMGYTPEQYYADPDFWFKTVHPNDLEQLKASLQNATPSSVNLLRFLRKDGTMVWIEGRTTPVFDHQGRLIAREGIDRDVTERKLADERIQRQIQRLNALRAIDTAITTSLDPAVTLEVLLEHVLMQLGVHAAAILRYNPDTQFLDYSLGTGFISNRIENTHLKLGESYAGEVAQQRHTISNPLINLSEVPQGFAKILSAEGFVAYNGTPLIAKGQLKGVLEVYNRNSFHPDREWLSYFETIAKQAAIAIDNAELFTNLQRANQELTLAYDTTLEGWVRALDLRDKETQGHTQRVVDMTIRIARTLNLGGASLQHIRRGALLHDIGKMAISDNILLKPGPLSDEEWAIMRKHPIYAYELLTPIEYLHPALEIPYCHHERWDGSGYPRKLKGEQIPLAARIFSVVDVWDALRSDRPYRQAWKSDQITEYIQTMSGVQFDPKIVELFFKLVPDRI